MQLPDFVEQDVSLARYSTLGVGGCADYFITVNSLRQLKTTHDFASKNQLDILVIGRGSNVLFSDQGFRGLVMRINLHDFGYHCATNEFWADAGTLVSEIVSLGENLGFSGFESFAGLPGTVGGAIYGNAGCYGKQFWDMVEEVKFFDGEYIRGRKKEAGMFKYRWSFFKDHPEYVIVSAKLKIEPSNSKTVIAETKRIRELRRANQPSQASAGCIFKNPPGDRSAGRLIDLAGLKGMRIGGAQISEKHANFFVNLGGAKASDFIKLIKITQSRVFENSGILLEEEIITKGKF